MFQNTPAFSGISGAADLFQAPAENNEIPMASTVSAVVEFEGTPIFESPEVEIPTTYKASKKSRKRRRTVDDYVEFFQLMAVFSPQLQLIEEQRDYYRLKLQRLLEKSL